MRVGKGEIRLLLADVDGTLLTPDKLLTPSAIAAVEALHRAGICFAITSGRPPRGLAPLVKTLGLQVATAGFNGGVYVNPDMSVIESFTLAPGTAADVVAMLEHSGLDVWIYTENDWLIRDPKAPHVARETSNVKFEPTVVAAFTPAHLARVAKIVGISDDLPRVAACETTAQATFAGRASAVRSQPHYLDVTHPRANKGAVVDTLCRLLALYENEVATIGDMPNDESMFGKSGLSIAMGNASDEVKAKADVSTDDNAHDGFAHAVSRFLLQAAIELQDQLP